MIDTKELRAVIQEIGLNGVCPAEIHELLDRLEAAEKSDAESIAMYHKARDERDALRANIEEMERQEPARLVTATAYRWRYRGAIKWQYGELTEEAARLAKEHNHEVQPLYTLPGAQPAPGVPVAALRPVIQWLRNGCDPMKAAKELEILIAAAPEAKP